MAEISDKSVESEPRSRKLSIAWLTKMCQLHIHHLTVIMIGYEPYLNQIVNEVLMHVMNMCKNGSKKNLGNQKDT